MELHPAPTSPKVHAAKGQSRFDQPARLPWVGVFSLILFISLAVSAGSLAGLAWLLRSYPDAPWLRPWSLTSTTIIKATPDPNARVTRPTRAVQQTLLIAPANDPAVIQPGDIRAVGVPLSSNGWLLTLQAALPSDGDLLVIGSDERILSVEKRVNDPAGIFTYLKVSGLTESPASFTPLRDDLYGQQMWLGQRWLGVAEVIETRLGPRTGQTWESSDHLDTAWLLASGSVSVDAAPLVDDRGYVYGMVDQHGQIWTTAGVEPMLKSLLQTGQVERPSLGIHALDGPRSLSREIPTQADGWRMGQTKDAPAVEPDSAADKAGLKSGDRIMTMDNERVAGPVWVWLQRFHPGQTVGVVYQRGGVQREATIELGSIRP